MLASHLPRRLAVLCAAGAMLAACEPAETSMEVDPAGAAEAAVSPPEVAQVAEAMDAQSGQRMGTGLTLASAEAEGDTLVINLRHDTSAAGFDAPARDRFISDFDRTFGAQMCAAPALRAFVETRGGVLARIVTADGQPLAERRVENCA